MKHNRNFVNSQDQRSNDPEDLIADLIIEQQGV